MDCCNFQEYRPQYWGEYGGYGQYGAPAAAAAPYAYSPYTPSPYAPEYAHHEHYARYSAYHSAYSDYPHLHHQQLAERDRVAGIAAASSAPPPIEYGGGGYVSKESRSRRAQARREAERARARTPATHHLPLPHTPTPPLECGSMVGRVPGGYGEQHVSWPHYQMGGGGGGGWGGGGGGGSAWGGRGGGGGGALHRDPLRHLAAMHDHCALRNSKGHNMSMLDQLATAESRAGPFSSYEEAMYAQRTHDSAAAAAARTHSRLAPEYVDYSSAAAAAAASAAAYERRDQPKQEGQQLSARATPPRGARPAQPATVPLPAFQQAFGSTEIGRFAEAFSRAEAAHDYIEGEVAASLAVELFPDWEPPDAAWPPPARPLKCENSY